MVRLSERAQHTTWGLPRVAGQTILRRSTRDGRGPCPLSDVERVSGRSGPELVVCPTRPLDAPVRSALAAEDRTAPVRRPYSARSAVAIRERAAQPAGTSAPITAITIPALASRVSNPPL
jgi:hypothetical protein